MRWVFIVAVTLVSVLILSGRTSAGRVEKAGPKNAGAVGETEEDNWPLDVDQTDFHGAHLPASTDRKKRVSVPKPPLYKYVPISTHWRAPVIVKERFKPVAGTLPLPRDIQRVLFPPRRRTPPLRPAAARPRPPPRQISVWCSNSKINIRVRRGLFGLRCQSAELTLGTGCKSSSASSQYYDFSYGLHECGSTRSIRNGQLTYSNVLRYAPPKPQGPVHRSIPFAIPIQCRFNRFHHVYKVGYQPVWPKRSYFKDLKNKHSFVLSTTNARWTRLSPKSVYYLGQPMYFQASAHAMAEAQRLYIHSCYATMSPDQYSEPRFMVIDNFGCMLDSKSEGCQSRFVPSKKNEVRFVVDAFQFDKKRLRETMLYLHCSLAVADEEASQGNKACTYNKLNKRWEELHGNHEVCGCCVSRCVGRPVTGARTVSSSPLHLSSRQAEAPEWAVEPTEPAGEVGRPAQGGAAWDSLPSEEGQWDEALEEDRVPGSAEVLMGDEPVEVVQGAHLPGGAG
ncbi:zona pellucida sperm-binding protein 3-like [Lepisosteus oculatus]|uniref:zona pellucida sperm-binding protein 3-like n=1 Tax=Lepisosteus oculatus TaxID=7918 RepID=UPI0035F50722